MDSKNKKKIVKQDMDDPIKPDLSKSGLPVAYQQLLSLIFESPDPLIYKGFFHDKISS